MFPLPFHPTPDLAGCSVIPEGLDFYTPFPDPEIHYMNQPAITALHFMVTPSFQLNPLTIFYLVISHPSRVFRVTGALSRPCGPVKIV